MRALIPMIRARLQSGASQLLTWLLDLALSCVDDDLS
jgi:hypothetical protein